MLSVIPILKRYKEIPRDQPQSYLPISICPVLSNLIESLVYNQMFSFLECSNLLNTFHFGFRRGKSTLNIMDNLVRQIHSVFEKKDIYSFRLLSATLKKPDCVENKILITKL